MNNTLNIVGDKQDILDMMASAKFGNLVKDILSNWDNIFEKYDAAWEVKLKLDSVLKESLE